MPLYGTSIQGYLNGIGMEQFDVAAVALLGLVFAVFVLIALAAAVVVRHEQTGLGSPSALQEAGSQPAVF
jgi:hypothetical protein